MNDTATLKIIGLEIKTHIGIHDWEQAIKQTIIIDLEFIMDLDKISDDINSTINYDSISKFLTEKISQTNFKLIETLAKFIKQILLENFNITPQIIRVHKPNAIKNAKDVVIEMNYPAAYAKH